MAQKASPEYLDKVKKLSKAESERLLSRMTGKLPKRLLKEKLSEEEAMAIQLEIEDEQLHEWRKVMQDLREKEAAKAAKEKQKASGKANKDKGNISE